MTAALAAGATAVAGQALASVRFDVPPGLALKQVDATRATTGFTGAQQAGNPQNYTVTSGATTLESASLTDATPANLTGRRVFDATGDSVTFAVKCESAINTECAAAPAPVSVDIARVGLKATDNSPPSVAVGNSRSPASGELKLDVRANDVGTGLNKAEAYVNGVLVSGARFSPRQLQRAQRRRRDRRPAPGPLGLHVRRRGRAPGQDDGLPGRAGLRARGQGDRLRGARGVLPEHDRDPQQVDLGTNVQTLNIGTSGVQTPATQNPNTNPNSGVAGAQAQSCSSPRLSFSLSQKPMRVSKGTPGAPVRTSATASSGRLTCVVKGKRVSAPKRTRVDIFNKVGKKTSEKAGTTVGDKGRLSIILSYPSSRTIIFRFTNSDGKRSQVSIKIKVESKKKSARAVAGARAGEVL